MKHGAKYTKREHYANGASERVAFLWRTHRCELCELLYSHQCRHSKHHYICDACKAKPGPELPSPSWKGNELSKRFMEQPGFTRGRLAEETRERNFDRYGRGSRHWTKNRDGSNRF